MVFLLLRSVRYVQEDLEKVLGTDTWVFWVPMDYCHDNGGLDVVYLPYIAA